MKLTIATIAATLTLAGAAAAMTETAGGFDDPRAAALGANGQVVSGTVTQVDIEDLFDARARALNSADTVDVTVFAQGAPATVQTNAEH